MLFIKYHNNLSNGNNLSGSGNNEVKENIVNKHFSIYFIGNTLLI
jgi:hypothetical protein